MASWRERQRRRSRNESQKQISASVPRHVIERAARIQSTPRFDGKINYTGLFFRPGELSYGEHQRLAGSQQTKFGRVEYRDDRAPDTRESRLIEQDDPNRRTRKNRAEKAERLARLAGIDKRPATKWRSENDLSKRKTLLAGGGGGDLQRSPRRWATAESHPDQREGSKEKNKRQHREDRAQNKPDERRSVTQTCKERPKHNDPRKRGGKKKRDFIPWCDEEKHHKH